MRKFIIAGLLVGLSLTAAPASAHTDKSPGYVTKWEYRHIYLGDTMIHARHVLGAAGVRLSVTPSACTEENCDAIIFHQYRRYMTDHSEGGNYVLIEYQSSSDMTPNWWVSNKCRVHSADQYSC